MLKGWEKQHQLQVRISGSYGTAAAGTHVPVRQESSEKWQRPWPGNAQLLEGLEGPYPIAAKQRACEMHLCNEKRRFFILSTVNSLNSQFLPPRES